MTQPRQYVPAPSFTYAPYGLLSALREYIRTPTDPHWRYGVTYETFCSLASTTYDECLAVSGTSGTASPPAPPPAKTATAALDQRGATSFTVYAEVDCSAVGFWERATELGERALLEAEQWQVEHALWTGRAAGQPTVFPHLAANAEVVDDHGIVLQTAATPITGAVLDPVEGLGRLEQALADCYNGVGIIHAPVSLATTFGKHDLIIDEGGRRYRTHRGNIVVFGAGYRGTGPDGVAPSGSAWVYATGSLAIYQGAAEIFPPRESIDRADNTVKIIAERTYLVMTDCCHFAANISLGGIAAGAYNSAGPLA